MLVLCDHQKSVMVKHSCFVSKKKLEARVSEEQDQGERPLHLIAQERPLYQGGLGSGTHPTKCNNQQTGGLATAAKEGVIR